MLDYSIMKAEGILVLKPHGLLVSAHHKQVERIAIVTDSPVASVAESLAKHFTSADVMHFAFPDGAKALGWLEAA